MDPIIKEKWVKALRSGEYKQGRQYLKAGDSFCCLGVLCEVAGLAAWQETDDGVSFGIFGDVHEYGGLPRGAREQVGLPADQHERLWKMNDRGMASFAEIADYIEEHL